MKLNDDVAVLPIAVDRNGQNVPLNLCLLLDAEHGPTLVDTGLPGQLAAIETALAELGLRVADLRRIVLTHQDLDHIGSLNDLVQASGARVLAGADEAQFIDGTALPRFARPETLAQRPDMRPAAEAYRPTPVDELLHDGARLDIAGGVRVIFTPGHTPGHISLYLERTHTLITGDAMIAPGGRLQGPNTAFTPDMAGAIKSVQRLAALDVATIICYHGGVVQDDAAEQLQAVAQTLTAG